MKNIKFLINEEGFYHQTKLGNGKFYRYSEINVLKERIEAISGKKVKTGSSRKTNRKQSKLVQGIMVLVGIVFVCASISFMFQSVKNYKNQLEQRDWQITTAKVTYVDERIESSGTRRHRSSHTVYNIDYQYEVDGNIYADNIYRTRIKKEYGEVFQIKYDTESPKDSTHILEPDLGSLVIGLVMESLFGLMGIRVLRMSLYKKNKKRS